MFKQSINKNKKNGHLPRTSCGRGGGGRGNKNYPSYLQKQPRYYYQGPLVENQSTGEIPQENREQKERSREWKRVGSRILIDNPQPSGPRVLVGKGWIFMSF